MESSENERQNVEMHTGLHFLKSLLLEASDYRPWSSCWENDLIVPLFKETPGFAWVKYSN